MPITVDPTTVPCEALTVEASVVKETVYVPNPQLSNPLTLNCGGVQGITGQVGETIDTTSGVEQPDKVPVMVISVPAGIPVIEFVPSVPTLGETLTKTPLTELKCTSYVPLEQSGLPTERSEPLEHGSAHEAGEYARTLTEQEPVPAVIVMSVPSGMPVIACVPIVPTAGETLITSEELNVTLYVVEPTPSHTVLATFKVGRVQEDGGQTLGPIAVAVLVQEPVPAVMLTS